MKHILAPVLPCNNIDRTQAFYEKIGFRCYSCYDSYRLLVDPGGAEIHLTIATEDWLSPDSNPCGIYFYTDDVDALAATFGSAVICPPEHKPWGTYEFAISDPEGTLVRIGRRNESSAAMIR